MRSLLITGTVGSGKTSIASALGDLLAADGIPSAVIDLDWLRRFSPAPADDRFNHAMTLRNLRVVAGNYRDAGAERLVLAGVVESVEERAGYEEALDGTLAVCRLRVELATVHERLRRRHADDPGSLDWHLSRSTELARILGAAQVEDFIVDVGPVSIKDAAGVVRVVAGW